MELPDSHLTSAAAFRVEPVDMGCDELSKTRPFSSSQMLFVSLRVFSTLIAFCRCSRMQAVSLAVDPAMIDRVFSNSPNLSTDAVKHFVTQLCAVSSQEVNHSAATFRCGRYGR